MLLPACQARPGQIFHKVDKVKDKPLQIEKSIDNVLLLFLIGKGEQRPTTDIMKGRPLWMVGKVSRQ